MPSIQLQSLLLLWHFKFASVSPRLIQHLFVSVVLNIQWFLAWLSHAPCTCHHPGTTILPNVCLTLIVVMAILIHIQVTTSHDYLLISMCPKSITAAATCIINMSCQISECLEDQQPHLLLGLSGLNPAMSASLICKLAALQLIHNPTYNRKNPCMMYTMIGRTCSDQHSR